MTERSETELSPVGASFAAHLRQFHAGLPAEEQTLLEEILALADHGLRADDTRGHALNAYLTLGGISGESADKRHQGQIEIESWSFGALLENPRR